MRKIVQIAFEIEHEWDRDCNTWDPKTTMWALTDDGNLWTIENGEWRLFDMPIPQVKSATAL
jgi:hypothetical protein